MQTSIERLEQELWSRCVKQRPPKDDEVFERWCKDELAHMRERFVIVRIPSDLNSLVEEATARWDQIETKVLGRLSMDRQTFIEAFDKGYMQMVSGDTQWMTLLGLAGATRGAVRNMDWVNLFAWVLPVADKPNRYVHLSRGRIVAAMFYIEVLARYGLSARDDASSPVGKIDARWRFVSSMQIM